MWKWFFRRAQKPREIPAAIVRSALAGVVFGPFVGFVVHWMSGNNVRILIDNPVEWIRTASGIGAIFATSFYLTCGTPWVFLRPVFRDLPSRKAWPLAICVSALGGSLGALISTFSAESLLHIQLVPHGYLLQSLAFDTVIAVVIGLFIALSQKIKLQAEIHERKLAETAVRAQSYALQAQIAPHFFFNTLNSISALIPVDPQGAQQMIGRLADIFRYTFTSGRDQLVPLERELDFVKEYLMLEKIRYRERLRIELPSTPANLNLKLPGLTLQPIVENAIRHGVARRLDGGTVRIEVQPNGRACHINIWNQYDPEDGAPDLSTGTVFRASHALMNVRDRLKLAFGDDAFIALSPQENDWVRVTLTIPTNGGDPHARSGS